jgi:glyoxylase-like metal-dependent hydrolase (beta-lactamase superfamily II)
MKIVDNVYMLDCSENSHVFLIKAHENILIDSGFPGASGKIIQELKTLGAENIHHILLTHHDVDHIGNAQSLQRQTGAMIWAPFEDIPYILGDKHRPGIKRLIQILIKPGIPTVLNSYQPAHCFGEVNVIKSPGHTPGHVILSYRNILFTGDLFMIIKGHFKMLPQYLNWNQKKVVQSVALLKNYEFDWLCPSHGQPHRRDDDFENFISRYV